MKIAHYISILIKKQETESMHNYWATDTAHIDSYKRFTDND